MFSDFYKYIYRYNKKNIFFSSLKSILFVAAALLFFSMSVPGCYIEAAAAPDYTAAMEERKKLEIQSNNTDNWPEGPAIGAQAAILMEVNTGTILYAKNIDEELYPASTTKMLTCLIAAENADMNDMVTFSYDAVHSVPRDGSNIGIDAGESMTLEQCLYGIMVGSANECANAVAEHVAGSLDDFADLMNKRAEELGCTHSHFVNANGLFNEDHYTSAHDLALIAGAFFSNELLSSIGNTARYHFTPTDTQPDDFYITNKHKLINGEISYDGILGGKTGYTDEARETLVTCASRNGMKLVCVVLKEESPYQFTDTATLFDYGFNNFQIVNVAETDNYYTPEDTSFFASDNDIFGYSGNVIQWNDDDSIILPITASIDDCTSEVSTDVTGQPSGTIAVVNYLYNGVSVGTARIITGSSQTSFSFSNTKTDSKITPNQSIYVDVKLIIIIVSVVAGSIIFVLNLHAFIQSLHYAGNDPQERKRYKRRQKLLKQHKLTYKKPRKR
jgi:D-alanyl-D-alanine carboxypeptidase